jgi:hypothetical protein
LTNNSDHTIYFKPETTMTIDGVEYDNGGSYALAPGQSWYHPIDGVAAPHIEQGEVFKLNDGITATVTNKKISWSGGKSYREKIGQSTWFNESGGWKGESWLKRTSSDINIIQYKHVWSRTTYNHTVWDKTNTGGGDKSWINLYNSAGA